ncbi:MAG TPA: MarR family winged helix-turn-helix transcriptional regulator [Solirubrobacterales bacterium]|jgi:DNA-binding MarR family transcriptional regulator|nr:MarR family winged helix-turn-helix transcriptional regulator [Solirubrobacterales bacterium]
MSDATDKTQSRLPLPGLMAVVEDALFAEFRTELVEVGYGDIRPTHGCVFRFIREEPLRLTELASLAGMTKQSIGEVIDNLVALGYAKRVPDPQDRRAKLICLTERGEEAQKTGRRLFAKVEQRWAERYGAERIAQLRDLLEEIAATESPNAVPELARPQLANA